MLTAEERHSATVPAQGQVFTGLSGCFGLLHARGTLLLCRVSRRTLLGLPLFHVLWHFPGRAVGAAQILLRVSGHRRPPVPLDLGRFLQASAWAVQGLLGLQGLTARLHRDERFSEDLQTQTKDSDLFMKNTLLQRRGHAAAFMGPLHVYTHLSTFRDACVLENWNQMEGIQYLWF